MKREIKFRVWNMYSKRMEFTDVEGWSLFGDCYMSDDDLPKMQYTGLKDRRGVDIYEGDIVEYDGFTRASVIFKSGCFMGYDGFASNSGEAYLLLEADSNPFDGDEFEIEVIGNIHENPELLK